MLLWEMKGSYFWLWPCGIKEEFVLLIYSFIDYTCICVFSIFLYMFLLLAHPICLCLAMIVYAVHVSK